MAFAQLAEAGGAMELRCTTFDAGHCATNRIAGDLERHGGELSLAYKPVRQQAQLGSEATNPLWRDPAILVRFMVDRLDDPMAQICRIFHELCSIAGKVASSRCTSCSVRYDCTYDRQPIDVLATWDHELRRMQLNDPPFWPQRSRLPHSGDGTLGS